MSAEESMDVVDDSDDEKVPQRFTMDFRPVGPTFVPSPPRNPLPGSQRVWRGGLADHLALLDPETRDQHMIDREEVRRFYGLCVYTGIDV